MKKTITVFVLMKNNSYECEQCLNQIRDISTKISFSNVIVLDAASSEKHTEIIRQYRDITYIQFSPEEASFAKMINMAVETLQMEEDFLVIDSCLLISPNLDAVFGKYENTEGKIGTLALFYESKMYSYLSENYDRYVLGSSYASVYIPYSCYHEVNGFDTNIQNAGCVMLDFQMRLLGLGYKNVLSCEIECQKISNHFSFPEEVIPTDSDYSYMEKKWKMRYFNWIPNSDLVQMIDKNRDDAINVLEIGCDCGATLLDIKSKFRNSSVYGVEINEPAANIASNFASIQIGNIENDEFMWDTKFDVIIFGDVLEHLHDPEKVLIKCKKYMKEEGCIICSIPNVQHISVVYPLLHGRFEYTDTGLLDKTHIHLFTGVEIDRLFQKAGYTIDILSAAMSQLNDEQEIVIKKLKFVFPDISENMFKVFQYQIRAKKQK